MQSATSNSPSSRPHVPKLGVRNRSSEPADALTRTLNNNSGSSVSSQAVSTPPTSPLQSEPRSSTQNSSSRAVPHSEQVRQPGKKRGTSFFSFFTLKEPSTEAFSSFQSDVRRQVASNNGRPLAVGLPGVSSARLPDAVPKVNSKWDGLPQAVRERERQQREQRRSARLSGVSSRAGMSSLLGRSSSRSSSSAVSSDSCRGGDGNRVSVFSDRSEDAEALFSVKSPTARPPSLSSNSDTKSNRHSPKSSSPARQPRASMVGTGLPTLGEPEEDLEQLIAQSMTIFTDGSPESFESAADGGTEKPRISTPSQQTLSPSDGVAQSRSSNMNASPSSPLSPPPPQSLSPPSTNDKRISGESYTSTGKRFINFSKPHPRPATAANPLQTTVPQLPLKSAKRRAKPLPFPAGEAQPFELPDN